MNTINIDGNKYQRAEQLKIKLLTAQTREAGIKTELKKVQLRADRASDRVSTLLQEYDRGFGVNHNESDNFAVEFWYSMSTNKARVIRLVYGREVETQEFLTLEAALTHIQENHWVEDVIEMESPVCLLN